VDVDIKLYFPSSIVVAVPTVIKSFHGKTTLKKDIMACLCSCSNTGPEKPSIQYYKCMVLCCVPCKYS